MAFGNLCIFLLLISAFNIVFLAFDKDYGCYNAPFFKKSSLKEWHSDAGDKYSSDDYDNRNQHAI